MESNGYAKSEDLRKCFLFDALEGKKESGKRRRDWAKTNYMERLDVKFAMGLNSMTLWPLQDRRGTGEHKKRRQITQACMYSELHAHEGLLRCI